MDGLQDDEQAARQFHGGPERALMQFPREHYTWFEQQPVSWSAKTRDKFKNLDEAWMGENLSTEGLTEESVCIGDTFQLGEATIQVSQPRSPCYKLNIHFEYQRMSQLMQSSARCGWLYRVLEPGQVEPNSPLIRLTRDSQQLSIAKVFEYFFHRPMEKGGLERLISHSGLTDKWRETALKRLKTGDLESWSARLGS